MIFKYPESTQRLSGKIIIVMNGKGGVGKDTFCDIVGHFFSTAHVSAITPIKDLARQCGWDGSKDPESRKFLSDLKRALVTYNQYPTQYLLKAVQTFSNDEKVDILFVDIREPEQIQRFIDNVRSSYHIPVRTILVRSTRKELMIHYGNSSDDDVEKFPYNYIFDNSGRLNRLEEKVWHFIVSLLHEEGLIGACVPFDQDNQEY